MTTRRSGDRSLINVSVVCIDHCHQISIGDQRLDWIVDLRKIDGIEESIDNLLLGIGEFGGVLVHREDDTNSSITESVESFLSKMDSMHLEIESSVVNGMLRSSMEMELSSVPLGVGTEDGRTNLGSERVRSIVEGNLGGVSNPLDFFIFLIRVDFGVKIISLVISSVGIIG